MTPRTRLRLGLALMLPMSALVAADWPHFLGPRYDLHNEETGLNLLFPESGPKLLWEVERGDGHAGPVVMGDRVVFFHQVESQEEIRCVQAATGKDLWKYTYPVEIGQSYGVVDVPRSSPVIDVESGSVYTLGNDGDLICLNLETGKLLWKCSLPETFGPSPNFFGYGSCPLVYEDKLIVNVGAESACVVAFNKLDGTVLWQSPHEWHGSYASPIVTKLNGVDRVLVFTGGKVKPPTGGLLCVNPEDGTIESAFPWRSSNYTSVNAASPVACDENRVFITEDYGMGGIMLEYDAAFQPRPLWTLAEFGCQFQTPIYHEGILYGAGGNGGLLMACDAQTGRVFWTEHFYRSKIEWQGRPVSISLGHAHLIHVEGAFLCLGEDGVLMRLNLSAAGYEVLAKTRLIFAPETWAPPVISNGRLYIMQNELGPKLLCFDVSGPTAAITSATE